MESLHKLRKPGRELHEIRRLWRAERGDWADSVPQIVHATLGRNLDWVVEDAVAFTADDARLLNEICSGHGVPTELVVRLLDVERAAHGLKRRHAVHSRIENLFRQEWRNLSTLLAERQAARTVDNDEALFEGEDDAPEFPLLEAAGKGRE